jgi:hypothetical protein
MSCVHRSGPMDVEGSAYFARRQILSASVLVALVLLLWARGAQAQGRVMHGPFPSWPSVGQFTIRTQAYLYDPKMPKGSPQIFVVARRADGVVVSVDYTIKSGRTAAQPPYRIIQYLDGSQAEVYDPVHAVVNWPADPQRREFFGKWALASAPRDCIEARDETFAGYALVGGISAAIVKLHRGSLEMTIWRAPDLGCAQLKDKGTVRNTDGSIQGEMEMELVSMKLGKPDPALFVIPRNYASVKPSQAWRMMYERGGWKRNVKWQADVGRDDIRYARAQKAAKGQN